MTRPNALVTGAGGFIGRHLVDRLLAIDMPVSVLVRSARPLPERWAGRLERIECGDWSEAGLRAAIGSRNLAVIFHLAAYGTFPGDRDIEQALRVNVELPATLVRLCKERGASLVMAGTLSEYRPPTNRIPLTELAPIESWRMYGSSKAAGGLVAGALAAHFGVGLRILRLFHTYGPGEAGHRLLTSLATGLRQGRRVALSAGTQVRDFVYVADAVEAFIRAAAHVGSHMASRDQPVTWNVCSGIGHSVRDFALAVAAVMGARRELLGFGDLELRADDVPWLVGNGERIAADLGWRPGYDIASGIRAALAGMTGTERLIA